MAHSEQPGGVTAWRLETGLNYRSSATGQMTRGEAGAVVTDLPQPVPRWLRVQGLITPVEEPPAPLPPTPEPAPLPEPEPPRAEPEVP